MRSDLFYTLILAYKTKRPRVKQIWDLFIGTLTFFVCTVNVFTRIILFLFSFSVFENTTLRSFIWCVYVCLLRGQISAQKQDFKKSNMSKTHVHRHNPLLEGASKNEGLGVFIVSIYARVCNRPFARTLTNVKVNFRKIDYH